MITWIKVTGRGFWTTSSEICYFIILLYCVILLSIVPEIVRVRDWVEIKQMREWGRRKPNVTKPVKRYEN